MDDFTLSASPSVLGWPHLCTEKPAINAMGWEALDFRGELGARVLKSRAISFALNQGLSQTELRFGPLQFQRFTDSLINLKE